MMKPTHNRLAAGSVGGSVAALIAGLVLAAQPAAAALPKPALTPAQAEAAAAKKAEADARAAKEKEALNASTDAVSARWRSRAAGQGWKISPPVAIAAAQPAAAGALPPGLAGVPGTAAAAGAAPGHGAVPLSPQALQSANVPVKSEKLGTAAPSEDVKKGPTRALPKGTPPTVDKGNADAAKNR